MPLLLAYIPQPTTARKTATPFLLTKEKLAEKRRDMGPYVFGCQMLQDPLADAVQGFRLEWLQHTETAIDPPKTYKGAPLNRYLLIDPANGRTRKAISRPPSWSGSARMAITTCWDMVRDRLGLTDRAKMVFRLHRKWKPLEVGYEEYRLQADIQHIESEIEAIDYRFTITLLGGRMGKNARIRRLPPLFEQGRVWLPP
jgi:hypothetical protein